jgi:serine/threonine protein kinase
MKHNINQCPIFISSSDSYSDLWPIFFDLFKKFWPEFSGVIYLNTEEQIFHFEGLNIICTQVGKSKHFGQTFRAGLDKIAAPNVLLIMIDYFLMGSINHNMITDYYEYFQENNYDSICLVRNDYGNSERVGFKDLNRVLAPSKNMFSYQIAFWRKDVLYKMALPHESPWLSEWYGTLRANVMKIKLAHISGPPVVPYLLEGALHKGKWVPEILEFLSTYSYKIDYDQRGYFKGDDTNISARLKARIKTFRPRFLSNLNLVRLQFAQISLSSRRV